MARGAIGKQKVIEQIAKAFGEDFIGEVDKKVYVWTEENGERIQIALTLTCPKTPVVTDNDTGDWDFSESEIKTAPTPIVIPEITSEEKEKVADLMKKLGL